LEEANLKTGADLVPETYCVVPQCTRLQASNILWVQINTTFNELVMIYTWLQ